MRSGAPQPPPASPSAAWAPPLLPGETCDRCGAAARHLVPVTYGPDGNRTPGQLTFCTHHFKKHEFALLQRAMELAR